MNIKLLFNFIKKFYNKNQELERNLNFTRELHNKKIFNYTNASFFDSRIVNYINYNYKYKNSITINNNRLIIYTIKKNDINKLKKILDKMISIILSIKSYLNRDDCPQKIIFIPTPFKKEFPQTDNIELGAFECNSGFSTYSLGNERINGDIVIYRLEECIKVLIHELLHSNKVDLYFVKNNNINNLNSMILSNYDILYNETHVETLAVIINIIFYTLFNNKSFDSMNQLLENEKNYSLSKMNQILNYHKIINLKSLTTTTKFPQKTNTFSYYILKPIVLLNIKKFLNLHDKQLNIKGLGASQDEVIKKYHKYLIKQLISHKYSTNNDYISNTLKMTYLEH